MVMAHGDVYWSLYPPYFPRPNLWAYKMLRCIGSLFFRVDRPIWQWLFSTSFPCLWLFVTSSLLPPMSSLSIPMALASEKISPWASISRRFLTVEDLREKSFCNAKYSGIFILNLPESSKNHHSWLRAVWAPVQGLDALGQGWDVLGSHQNAAAVHQGLVVALQGLVVAHQGLVIAHQADIEMRARATFLQVGLLDPLADQGLRNSKKTHSHLE